MQIKITLIFLFFIFITSCQQNSTQTELNDSILLEIDFDDSNLIHVKDFIDQVTFVPLETNDSCLISRIARIHSIDTLLFVHDIKTNSIYVFNEKGKHLYNINKKGQGPGEYISLNKFLIDESKKQLIIYDADSRKLLYYTLNGKYIKEINKFGQNVIIRDIINLPDGNFLCYTPDYTKNIEYQGIFKLDSLGNPDKIYFNSEKYPILLKATETYFNKLSDGTVTIDAGDYNKIFHFKDDSLKCFISYITNKKSPTDYPNIDFESTLPMTPIMEITEKENYILTTWYDFNEEKAYQALYSKKIQKLDFGKFRFNNDLTTGIPSLEVHFNDPNKLLNVIYGYQIPEILESKMVSEEIKEILRKVPDPENANPVLEIQHLKK
ncbi:6-bladed beta-propeller [Coprobacter sp.]